MRGSRIERALRRADANYGQYRRGNQRQSVEGEAECGHAFVDEFLPRAFRRPIEAEERTAFMGLFDAGHAQHGFSEAVSLVVQAALQSPQLLYRLEPVPDDAVPGDVLPVTATLQVDAELELDPASLPRPGPVTYWLDLRSVTLEEDTVADGQRTIVLGLRYQTFYAPLEPKEMKVPAVALELIGGGGRVSLDIPDWSFVTSPIREIMAPSTPAAMAPDSRIGVIDTYPAQMRAIAGLVVGLLALVALAWHRGIGPFARRSRPFALAAGQVRRLMRKDPAAGYRAALLSLHRAFDAAFGRRLLAGDVDAFVAGRPSFGGLATELAAFFAASRALFFGAGAVLNATGRRDMETMGGLIHRMPWVAWLALVGTLAIAGLPPELVPRTQWLKGSYFRVRGPAAFTHLVYPVPDAATLGIHVTLDLAGRVRLGPDQAWVDHLDYAVDPGRAPAFARAVAEYYPALEPDALEPDTAGIRPKLHGPGQPAPDFMIQGPADHGIPGLCNLFGIESPGLTASLAIAERVAMTLGLNA